MYKVHKYSNKQNNYVCNIIDKMNYLKFKKFTTNKDFKFYNNWVTCIRQNGIKGGNGNIKIVKKG